MDGTPAPAVPHPPRVIRKLNDWTLKEHEVVVSYWPDVRAIRKCLPHRTEAAIRAFAAKCNLTTSRHVWTGAMDAKLRRFAAAGWSRKDIAGELGLRLNQVAGRLSYTGTKIASKPPAPSAHPLVNAIRQRAFSMNMTMIDLDRSLGSRKIFQQAAGKQNVSHVHIRKAVEALGGKLTIEWSEE